MSSRTFIWGGMMAGSTIGSFVPYLWNGDFFETSLWGAVGGLLGIWIGFKLAKASGAL